MSDIGFTGKTQDIIVFAPSLTDAHVARSSTNYSLRELSALIHAAKTKVAEGRQAWVAASIDLSIALATARRRFSDNGAFGRWLEDEGHGDIGKNDRAALINMAACKDLTQVVLAETTRTSYRLIWENDIRPIWEDLSRLPTDGKTAPSLQTSDMSVSLGAESVVFALERYRAARAEQKAQRRARRAQKTEPHFDASVESSAPVANEPLRSRPSANLAPKPVSIVAADGIPRAAELIHQARVLLNTPSAPNIETVRRKLEQAEQLLGSDRKPKVSARRAAA